VFDRPTVFVVGAGASSDFDLPTGDGLIKTIAPLLDLYFEAGHLTRGDHQVLEAIHQHARATVGEYHAIGHLIGKARLISEAMPAALSIDNFIDAHRGDGDLEICAKLAIVKSILIEERKSNLFGITENHKSFDFWKIRNTWLVRFFQMASENISVGELRDIFCNVSIVVFNYDRCIEAFIPRMLSHYYGIAIEKARDVASTLRIVHPYGMVGTYTSLHGLSVDFGSTELNLLQEAKGIRTFCEGVADPALAGAVSELLGEAETLVFLGFAFHPINMRLLDVAAPNLRRIFATTYGLSKSSQSSVEDEAVSLFGKEAPTVLHGYEEDALEELAFEPLTASEFCAQYFRSLSSASIEV
jgi:hypothetical protein